MSVEDILTKKVISVDKNRKLSDAINLMEKKRISMVVVTTGGELCGILTEKDIADHIGTLRHGDTSPSSLHISTAMKCPVISVGRDVSVKMAAETMLKEGISSLPIIEEKELIGIVTKTDIVKTLKGSEEKLENIMRRGIVTVSENDRIVHARRLMMDKGIGRVVVVDEGRIVGILTERRATRAIFVFKQVTEKRQSSRIRNIMVKDAMTFPVMTLDASATVKDALEIMLKNKFSGMPVTSKGKLAGIVTKTDMLRIK